MEERYSVRVHVLQTPLPTAVLQKRQLSHSSNNRVLHWLHKIVESVLHPTHFKGTIKSVMWPVIERMSVLYSPIKQLLVILSLLAKHTMYAAFL
ncbi:MAG: hypothetical protein A3C80_04475 [Candidatus Ryanbacteria bacterium RIFCSPHIGHO2_02_FULL_45_43]|nr:MAG: hypothetical protein A2718_04375 [Candidatus Ryanbacteria bacterium RIFCSPHIGHO2_01_FULL_44_130]OGZ49130.1 MAG: hypothetical protein A3C80_04475 [Candidatus Ryanbacteria bacterium RIFCSPHIGHO2_02_FULL_45_43]OGZ51390.1 MAG: hypothetical protein A3A17_00175 [Candidatus Ryanbacteria bacterium RIFCSPLOWO2_01_FULL_44_230]OGZ53704.1 MAG: hypothetical protein A3H62_00925 [Candidatus Ryanbacteria bacterium RIFCSPLOWO2_02_FULL_44_40]OGZ55673.1 MAG: hypothetical protein A3F85_02560 [Candidatus Ry